MRNWTSVRIGSAAAALALMVAGSVMGFTNQVLRPAWMPPGGLVMIGEAPATEAPPITAWYEIGQTMGHEFRY